MILFIFWHVLRNVNSTLSMRLTMHLIEIWGLLYCIDHIHTILENAWKIIPFHGRFAHKRARFWPVKVVNIWVDANSCCSCVYNLKILLNSSSFACSEKSTMNSQIMAKRHGCFIYSNSSLDRIKIPLYSMFAKKQVFGLVATFH